MGSIINSVENIALPLVNPTIETCFSYDGTNRLALSSNNAGCLDGRMFIVRACIFVTGGTTTNFKAQLRGTTAGGVGLTSFTNDELLVTGTNFAVNSTSAMYFLVAYCVWDTTTLQVMGWSQQNLNNTNVSPTAFTTPMISRSLQSDVIFLLTGVFSASNANNLAVLTEFSMEQP